MMATPTRPTSTGPAGASIRVTVKSLVCLLLDVRPPEAKMKVVQASAPYKTSLPPAFALSNASRRVKSSVSCQSASRVNPTAITQSRTCPTGSLASVANAPDWLACLPPLPSAICAVR